MHFAVLLRATLALAFVLAPLRPALANTNYAGAPENAYAREMRTINPRLPETRSRIYAATLLANSERMHLDPRLVMAVVTVESHWNEAAVSVDGAVGLGQLKPETARRLGVDAWSGQSNLRGITLYLHRLIGLFSSSRTAIGSAIASYNAGPIAVRNNGGRAPNHAAQHYVVKVLAAWRTFQARLGPQPQLATATAASPADALADAQTTYWTGL